MAFLLVNMLTVRILLTGGPRLNFTNLDSSLIFDSPLHNCEHPSELGILLISHLFTVLLLQYRLNMNNPNLTTGTDMNLKK